MDDFVIVHIHSVLGSATLPCNKHETNEKHAADGLTGYVRLVKRTFSNLTNFVCSVADCKYSSTLNADQQSRS